MDLRGADINTASGIRKGNNIQQKLALFTGTPVPPVAGNGLSNPSSALPPATPVVRKAQDKPFVSLYERTLALIAKLYSVPDFEYYLFPGGIDALLQGDAQPVIDPISILWGCFRLGAPFCHLLNQLHPKNILSVPDVSGITSYTNACKKCVYQFLVGVKEELGVGDDDLFSISELYKDDTNGLVKVIHVVEMVLEEMESRGLAPPAKPFPFATTQKADAPQDNRSKSVAELLATERKYIESLQELMAYQQELVNKNAISNDTVHSIFANLPELLDFQRRFLFSLEAVLAQPLNEQNIGSVFLQYEDGFQVYNAMCASYANAINVAIENADRMSGIGAIDPVKGLQGYLIKPVQRICRYPMLLKEIIKHTPEDFAYYKDLQEAEVVMKKATDNVNEVQRMEENKAIKNTLLESIDDLQSLNPAEWGDLLLTDRFPMTANNEEQIYNIYLFENLILCCREGTRDAAKPRKNKDSKMDGVVCEIKGKIYATSISDVVDVSDADTGRFEIKVYWNEMEESFILKCRNIEQVALWKGRILACSSGNTNFLTSRVSSESDERRSSYRRNVTQSVNANMFYDASRRVSVDSTADRNRVASLPAATRSITRNGTEMPTRGSSIYMPAAGAHRRTASGGGPLRTREPSGDDSQPRPPGGALPQPPLAPASRPPAASLPAPPTSSLPQPPPFQGVPRSLSVSSGPMKGMASAQPPSSSLPKPPSALPITSPPSAALPRPPTSALPQPPAQEVLSPPPRSVLPQPPQTANGPPRAALPQAPTPVSNGPPKASLPAAPPSVPVPSPPRSQASTPVTSPPRSALPRPGGSAPMPTSMPPTAIPSPSPSPSRAMPPSSAVPTPSSANRSAPSTPRSATPGGSSGFIKMKVHYGVDIFIIAVPSLGAKYEDILEKIERKIKICGAAMPDGRRIKLRYKDEDGDFITISTDEDVEMAFEVARRTSPTVTIQAE
ncbi:hypothetical protein HDU91_007276 [Kappamyces sp. JEL0680]|nr:hypothetical protein HDU91_007276 [Kappamyces sp. JEL0680]